MFCVGVESGAGRVGPLRNRARARLSPAATLREKQIPHTARKRRERVRDDIARGPYPFRHPCTRRLLRQAARLATIGRTHRIAFSGAARLEGEVASGEWRVTRQTQRSDPSQITLWVNE